MNANRISASGEQILHGQLQINADDPAQVFCINVYTVSRVNPQISSSGLLTWMAS